MSKIDVLVFFHIIGVALIAAGAGVGIATGIAMPRTDSVRSIRSMSSLAERAEHFVIAPGALLTLLTGTWLIIDYEFFDFGETWLWLSYVLWVIAVVLGEAVLAPFNKQLRRQATALKEAGTERSEDLQKAAGRWVGPVTGSVLTLLFIAFVYLMVFRPGS